MGGPGGVGGAWARGSGLGVSLRVQVQPEVLEIKYYLAWRIRISDFCEINDPCPCNLAIIWNPQAVHLVYGDTGTTTIPFQKPIENDALSAK